MRGWSSSAFRTICMEKAPVANRCQHPSARFGSFQRTLFSLFIFFSSQTPCSSKDERGKTQFPVISGFDVPSNCIRLRRKGPVSRASKLMPWVFERVRTIRVPAVEKAKVFFHVVFCSTSGKKEMGENLKRGKGKQQPTVWLRAWTVWPSGKDDEAEFLYTREDWRRSCHRPPH